MTPLPAFQDARERSLWVQMQLKVIGLSLSQIARDRGWARGTVASAMFMPSLPQEEAIAAALGVSVPELFPERYGPDGQRLHVVRETTPKKGTRNVKNRRGA